MPYTYVSYNIHIALYHALVRNLPYQLYVWFSYFCSNHSVEPITVGLCKVDVVHWHQWKPFCNGTQGTMAGGQNTYMTRCV